MELTGARSTAAPTPATNAATAAESTRYSVTSAKVPVAAGSYAWSSIASTSTFNAASGLNEKVEPAAVMPKAGSAGTVTAPVMAARASASAMPPKSMEPTVGWFGTTPLGEAAKASAGMAITDSATASASRMAMLRTLSDVLM